MALRPSHDGWKNAEFLTALDNYRDAVAHRAWQAEHGTHGDGRLDQAREAEREARRAVVAIWHAA
jgi:hypothetical protein